MSASPIKPIYLPPIEQGQSDYRTYRPLILPTPSNDEGITILLVNDPQSKHFAASVSVGSGASSDPRALPGLAHFCEHMCFLGSTAYPQENEYKQYLSQHGGKSNASTSMSHTTYQFDVLADHAEKALDIFSHFFIGPLFTRSGTGREVHAVDSENSKNLVSDGRRRWQVLKSLGDENHHFSKFSTGNKFTLPVGADMHNDDAISPAGEGSESSPVLDKHSDRKLHPLTAVLKKMDNSYDEEDMPEFVRAALLAFHKRHYRPKNMAVVVVGPQSLDTLESWVVPRFSNIPDLSEADTETIDKDISRTEEDAKWERLQVLAAKLIDQAAKEAPPVSVTAAKDVKYNPAFRPELQGGEWPVVVTTKPLQSVRKLVLFFPMHPTYDNPDRSPTRILSHLFGHEGRGSPFAVLQDYGWISSLSSGTRVGGPDQNLFQIDMSLTEEGEEHWKRVAEIIFAYAKILGSAVEVSLKSEDANLSDGICSSDDVLRRIWDEVAQIDRMHYHQTSPGAVYSFASSVAQSITKYATTKCLSVGSMLDETPETLPAKRLASYCKRITPDNCFIERCSEKAWGEAEATYKDDEINTQSSGTFSFGKQTEKWYGIDYYISPVDDKDVNIWKNPNATSLHLPGPNLFIPRSLDLCPELPDEARTQRIDKPIDAPKLIVNNSFGRLWHRLDDRYALPKASLTLLIRTPTSEHKLREAEPGSNSSMYWDYDSETAMRSNLLMGVFSDAMAQDTYDAYIAGLNWSLSKSSSGYTLSCYGYSDRLADLGLKLLEEFTGNFVEESYFQTNKDKAIRGLKSFFESKRADSLAMYYRNLLMNWRSGGMEESLEVAKAITLEDVISQHKNIWSDTSMVLECLYSGNVSEGDAKNFFDKAIDIIKTRSKSMQSSYSHTQKNHFGWVPGPYERRLPSEDIELHFQSKNSKEENGAVIVTYQSQTPGFKGKSLSSEDSLRLSAAIRLLCAILKEPFFDELRTKQQLGYIVSSYYDINFTSRQPNLVEALSSTSPLTASSPLSTTSVDSIVLYVLSRKEEPKEVVNRIDDFLLNFRSRLETMDQTKIQGYADSLASSLTKPIRKLSEEAKYHFAKIRRYAPEVVVDGGKAEQDLGWDNPEVMASAITSLDRTHLLHVFDNLILKKDNRARVVSTVYGKTYPMPTELQQTTSSCNISSVESLLAKRTSLIPFDPTTSYHQPSSFGSLLLRKVGKNRMSLQYVAAAAAVIGVGAWAIGLRSSSTEKKQIK